MLYSYIEGHRFKALLKGAEENFKGDSMKLVSQYRWRRRWQTSLKLLTREESVQEDAPDIFHERNPLETLEVFLI